MINRNQLLDRLYVLKNNPNLQERDRVLVDELHFQVLLSMLNENGLRHAEKTAQIMETYLAEKAESIPEFVQRRYNEVKAECDDYNRRHVK